ncbi:MAG: VIT1/CCC1 transporter family protein [Candidatus Doudnabacteria bacterium]|nr:VIT1/CCC1 transporter family protein [Candidatus Doudnabacteria bacterium]
MNETRDKKAAYTRSFIFGVEDSLVSTVGLLTGIAVVGIDKQTIVLIGIILIFVEAFSMAIGDLLSEHSAQEYSQQSEIPIGTAVKSGIIMFFAYFLSGFIPLFPYFVWDPSKAYQFSIAGSLLALFILGSGSARFSKTRLVKHGLQMMLLGGFAIAVGVLAGQLTQKIL